MESRVTAFSLVLDKLSQDAVCIENIVVKNFKNM